MPTPVFYVPGLSPHAGKRALPPDLAFFPTGLSSPSERGERNACSDAARQTEQLVSQTLPLSSNEAKAALNEMLRMGEEFSAGGLLKELAAQHHLSSLADRRQGRPGETADLAFFASTGEVPDRGEPSAMRDWGSVYGDQNVVSPQDVRRELENCQKVLLLAQSLEQREKELAELEKRYEDLAASLQGLLGEGQEEGEAVFALGGAAKREEDLAERADGALSWRAVVDAALPFLPGGAVLFTDDERMALDMRDAGMLQPFPEDKAALCSGWPQDLTAGLLHAQIPAWRLVGRRGALLARPWLKREVEVLVARPAGGWAALRDTHDGAGREGKDI